MFFPTPLHKLYFLAFLPRCCFSYCPPYAAFLSLPPKMLFFLLPPPHMRHFLSFSTKSFFLTLLPLVAFHSTIRMFCYLRHYALYGPHLNLFFLPLYASFSSCPPPTCYFPFARYILLIFTTNVFVFIFSHAIILFSLSHHYILIFFTPSLYFAFLSPTISYPPPTFCFCLATFSFSYPLIFFFLPLAFLSLTPSFHLPPSFYLTPSFLVVPHFSLLPPHFLFLNPHFLFLNPHFLFSFLLSPFFFWLPQENNAFSQFCFTKIYCLQKLQELSLKDVRPTPTSVLDMTLNNLMVRFLW